MNDHSVTTNYNQITDGLFVGSNFCCKVHFVETLATQGVTSVVSLEGERTDQASGVDSHLWLPTPDMNAPEQEQLALGAKHIASVIDQGHKVYVHCRNGHGRAPTMGCCYLISTGMSAEEAVEFMVSKRKETHMNAEQQEAVKEFARTWQALA